MQSKASENSDNIQPVSEGRLGSDSNNHRRRLLAAMVGGATATIWHKPVIDSVILPAHAQTSPGVTSGASAPGTGGATGSSSGGVAPVDSSSSSSSSGGSSSGGSSGGNTVPRGTLTLLPPSYTSKVLTAGACLEDCDGTDMLIIVDLYDAAGNLLGSFQNNLDVAAPQCLSIEVTSDTFGFSEWKDGTMFALAVSVPDCNLQESTSGFFNNVGQAASSNSSSGSDDESKSK